MKLRESVMTGILSSSRVPLAGPCGRLAICFLVAASLGAGNLAATQVGYRDFNFGSTVNSTPTGEKPESKLWWNDGLWWGMLWSTSASAYHIYRFNPAAQSWADTGTAVDDRAGTKGDVLWDGAAQKLYAVSHIFTTDGQPTSSSSEWGRLYRYTYDPGAQTYSRDTGFPVTVTKGKEETLVLAKDSAGRLWVAYVENSKVMVNHSVSSDLVWSTPYVLPASNQAVSLNSDDISSVIAFGGDRIGVFWTNQVTAKDYFAVHLDADGDKTWHSEEIVLPDSNCSGACADDHINLKTDSSGRVYAAVKTSLTGSDDPLVMLVVRDSNAGWSSYAFDVVSDHHTRPIVLLDEEHGRLYLFATHPESGGSIYYKTTDINNISFPTGVGTAFIQNSTDTTINNATSTKQNLNSATGLLVVASDQNTHFYSHNYLSFSFAPVVSSFSPTSGTPDTSVTLSGSNFTGTTAVAFHGTAATFTVASDTRITTTVPAGATSGAISVTNASGTGTSTSAFTIISTPVISSFTPTSGPIGTSVTLTGSAFTGATAVAFNGAAASFTVVSDSRIDTTVPSGATTGTISVTTAAGTGTGTSSFSVTPAGSVPPAIASFAPTSGAVGTAVTLTGSNFTGTTAVAFNGAAASFTVVSDSRIDTTVPSGATTGAISATNGAGTGVSGSAFTVISAPVISSFAPASGPVGTTVTLTGSGFTGATAVGFNGTAASFTVASDSRIDTTVPTGASTGAISVTNTAGTGTSASAFTVSSTRLRDTTFEGGSLTDPATGASKVSGTVNLETAAPLKGQYSARVPNVSNSYVEDDFASADNLYASFYVRVNALPSADLRIAVIFNSSSAVGNIVLRTTGALSLVNSSSIVGSDSASLTVGQSYRIGIHQQKGTGRNAVLEGFLAQGDDQFGAAFASTGKGRWKTAATSFRAGATVATAVDLVVDDLRLDTAFMPLPSINLPPTVTSFTPTSGAVGTTVTLTGNGFTGATAVAFNGTAAAFTVVSDTRITTTVPAGATSGAISVTNAAGTGASSSAFTVVPPPVISSLAPASGPVGTPVTLTGSNFTGATAVAFNGAAASFTVVSDSRIDTTVPSGATTGTISVTTAAGTGTSTSSFTVTTAGSAPPAIASFAPTSGAVGTAVTLTGSNFTGTTAVAFNGTAASFTVASDSRIDTTVPSGATTGTISATNGAGTGVSGSAFTVISAPVISSFAPTSGPVGTSVTLTGSGFSGATAVGFNGTAASFTVVSDSQVNTTVPSGATTGAISITNAAGTGTSASAFTVSSTRLKDTTFEGGSLTGSTGASKVSGTVNLETAAPLKGYYSVRIPIAATDSWFEDDFASVDNLYVSFYVRVNTLPSADLRIALISNAGITVGNIVLRTTGALRLRNSSTTIGSDTAPLAVGQLYRVGIHQQDGTGSNAVLEGFLAQGDNQFATPFASTSSGTWTTPATFFRGGATVSTAVDLVMDDIRLDTAFMPPPSTGLPPAVASFTPTSGPAGTTVTLTGNSFAGGTAVAFNGAAASFAVVSDTQITATVPSNATTGRITITNAAGTGTSLSDFTVTGGP
ncbi:MAG: hypothetical protein DMG25_03875 [Acidobacteria bacterium]|nr:MAG: hypothetical protein DMG25_03875 [Acidobacteriota bacterium]